MSDTGAARTQLARQIAHWTTAVARLRNLEDLASSTSWNSLEQYLGTSIRKHLTGIVDRLENRARLLRVALDDVSSESDERDVHRDLVRFRRHYLRAEVTLDFFADAINSRTSPTICGLLNACDTLGYRGMAQVLDQIGKPTPVVLTYLDKGLGASILKAGLRLWDGGGVNPVAAIKIALHNLHRPTALMHEIGHQAMHIAAWNGELSAALESCLHRAPAGVASVWASWASEIAADAYAFVHTGYASVAALHDVVAGDARMVLRHVPGDPHPLSYLRVLLGVEMCRQWYGDGPWDALASNWVRQYPVDEAPAAIQTLIHVSVPVLSKIADTSLRAPMRAFGDRPLSALVDPGRVGPAALDDLERRVGAALYTSTHWIWTEAPRLLALTGLKMAIAPERAPAILEQQEQWMLRLGGVAHAA
jgi:hypothetical protein